MLRLALYNPTLVPTPSSRRPFAALQWSRRWNSHHHMNSSLAHTPLSRMSAVSPSTKIPAATTAAELRGPRTPGRSQSSSPSSSESSRFAVRLLFSTTASGGSSEQQAGALHEVSNEEADRRTNRRRHSRQSRNALMTGFSSIFGAYKPCGVPYFSASQVSRAGNDGTALLMLSSWALSSSSSSRSVSSASDAKKIQMAERQEAMKRKHHERAQITDGSGALLSRVAEAIPPALPVSALSSPSSSSSSADGTVRVPPSDLPVPYVALPLVSPLLTAAGTGTSPARVNAWTSVEKGVVLLSTSAEEAMVIRNAARMGLVRAKYRVVCHVPANVSTAVQRWWAVMRRKILQQQEQEQEQAQKNRQHVNHHKNDAANGAAPERRRTAVLLNPYLRRYLLGAGGGGSSRPTSGATGLVSSPLGTDVSGGHPHHNSHQNSTTATRPIWTRVLHDIPLVGWQRPTAGGPTSACYAPHPLLSGHLVRSVGGEQDVLRREGRITCTLRNAGSKVPLEWSKAVGKKSRLEHLFLRSTTGTGRHSDTIHHTETGIKDNTQEKRELSLHTGSAASSPHPWIPKTEQLEVTVDAATVASVAASPGDGSRAHLTSAPLTQAVSLDFRLLALSSPETSMLEDDPFLGTNQADDDRNHSNHKVLDPPSSRTSSRRTHQNLPFGLLALYEVESDGTLSAAEISAVFAAEGFIVVNDFVNDLGLAEAMQRLRERVGRLSPAQREAILNAAFQSPRDQAPNTNAAGNPSKNQMKENRQKRRSSGSDHTTNYNDNEPEEQQQEEDGLISVKGKASTRIMRPGSSSATPWWASLPMQLQHWISSTASPEELVYQPLVSLSVETADQWWAAAAAATRAQTQAETMQTHTEIHTQMQIQQQHTPHVIARALIHHVLQNEKEDPWVSGYGLLPLLALGSGVECVAIEYPDPQRDENIHHLQFAMQRLLAIRQRGTGSSTPSGASSAGLLPPSLLQSVRDGLVYRRVSVDGDSSISEEEAALRRFSFVFPSSCPAAADAGEDAKGALNSTLSSNAPTLIPSSSASLAPDRSAAECWLGVPFVRDDEQMEHRTPTTTTNALKALPNGMPLPLLVDPAIHPTLTFTTEDLRCSATTVAWLCLPSVFHQHLRRSSPPERTPLLQGNQVLHALWAFLRRQFTLSLSPFSPFLLALHRHESSGSGSSCASSYSSSSSYLFPRLEEFPTTVCCTYCCFSHPHPFVKASSSSSSVAAFHGGGRDDAAVPGAPTHFTPAALQHLWQDCPVYHTDRYDSPPTPTLEPREGRERRGAEVDDEEKKRQMASRHLVAEPDALRYTTVSEVEAALQQPASSFNAPVANRYGVEHWRGRRRGTISEEDNNPDADIIRVPTMAVTRPPVDDARHLAARQAARARTPPMQRRSLRCAYCHGKHHITQCPQLNGEAVGEAARGSGGDGGHGGIATRPRSGRKSALHRSTFSSSSVLMADSYIDGIRSQHR